MAAVLESILKISAQTSGAEGIARLRQSVTDLGKAGKAAEVGMKGLGGAVAGLGGVMNALTPLLSIAGIMALGNKAIEAGDKFNDLAQKTGVSVEALAKFGKAAALNGTDVDGVAKALAKLSKGMLEAATTGKGPVAEALQMLGISATDASGQLLGADEVMLRVADRFKTLPDGATKTALALQLFGKAGADMIPMLNQGGEAIEKLGVRMTAEFAAKADEYNDKLTMLGGAVNSLGMTIADVLLPTLIDMTDRLIGFAKQVTSYVEEHKAGLEVVLNGINAAAYATESATKRVLENVATMGRFWGRLLAGDIGGAFQEITSWSGKFRDQAGKDFQEIGRILSGAGSSAKGAMTAVKQEMQNIQIEQDKAKEKQAQWKAWVDATEMSYKRTQFAITQAQQANAGQMKIMDARVGAEQAINNAAKTLLQIKLSTAKTDAERLLITKQIAAIDVDNARLQMNLAKAQAAASVQEVQFKIQQAKTSQAQAAATLAEAKARGVVTIEYEKALQAQTDLVRAAIDEYQVAKEVAKYKGQAADATYSAAVAQAEANVAAFEMQAKQNAITAASQQAANNIRELPSSLDAAAESANRLADGLQKGSDAAGSMSLGLAGMAPTTPGGTVAAMSKDQWEAFLRANPQGTSGFSSFGAFAAGGYVQRPTVALVGEGAEPEYVVPASKMARASTAYLAGARGSAVLSSTSATSGAARPQINITTGPVLQFDGQRYVKIEDLERAMRTTADAVLSRVRTPAGRRLLGVR